ncbi:hypothetical protein N7450_007991 [Penicillium hetheringtonii]|uniref:Uncharacterized protein n=1 Tax=Penicillium hetheringtonii TaxID=911720 RepID=A0AAD6GPH2_9EURO|nr:hypothetical protein N7450_007991 [Penicillium hetheringtonii]
MDSEAESRMRALQMADLGSSRRDHVSTHEDVHYASHISLQEIEAGRAFHKVNTAAGRQANIHKDKLTAWAVYGEEVKDLDNIEKLPTLKDGQTHRVRLSEAVKAQGGQQYGEGSGRRAQSKHENHHPLSGSLTNRRFGPGGIRAGRGRASTFRGRPGGPAMRSQSLVLPSDSGPTRQDPALDSNNDESTAFGKRGNAGRRGFRDSDYTTHVADAEAFMASARGYLRSESLRKASVSPSRPPVTTAQPAQKASRSFSESPTRRSAIRNPVQAPAKNVAPEKALSPRPIVNLPINPAAVTRKIIDKAAVAATKIVDTPKPIHKDQLPKTLVEDLLIDFSSDDDTPRQSTKALSKLSNELLVDLGDEFFDAPEDAGGKGILSETTQKQLLGLDLTPSKLPLSLDKGYDLEGMGAEDVDEILQNKTAQATDPIDAGSIQSRSSFTGHRSPAQGSTSSSQRTKTKSHEGNLSPFKPGHSEFDPLKDFKELHISEPPGLAFGTNEPKTAAARQRAFSSEKDVCPELKRGGIGSLAQSCHAFDVEHSRAMGQARTVGVKPSLTCQHEAEVTVEYQRASHGNSRTTLPPSTQAVPLQ